MRCEANTDKHVQTPLSDRIWYKNEYGTIVPYSVEYGTNVPYSDRIWYNFRPNMVQTLYHNYSVGISFSMLAKTYLVHTKKTHKMKMAYVYGT